MKREHYYELCDGVLKLEVRITFNRMKQIWKKPLGNEPVGR